MTLPPSGSGSSSASVEKYCRDVYVSEAVGRDDFLIHGRLGQATAILPAAAAAALRRCDAFRPLDEHARRLADSEAATSRTGPPEPPTGTRATTRSRDGLVSASSVLQTLRDAGLLVSHDQVLRRISAGAAAASGGRAVTLGIVTRDRTNALACCAASYARNIRDCGRRVELLVVDDSRHPVTQQANRHCLSTIAAEYGVAISYAGELEKRAYADALVAETGCSPTPVRYALLPPSGHTVTTGSNRNALLLATAGRLLLSVDDDTVCRVVQNRTPSDRLRLAARDGEYEHYFSTNEDTAAAFPVLPEFDLIGAHECLLGRTLAECLRTYGAERVDVEALPEWLSRPVLRTNGAVWLTSVGSVGDAGNESPDWYLFLRGPSQTRLLESEARYRSAMTIRELLRIPSAASLTAEGGWMTYCAGIDNRRTTPPFLPVGRNQDGLFFHTLTRCAPSALAAHLPSAVTHVGSGVQRYPSRATCSALTLPRICDILSAVVQDTTPCTSDDAAANLVSLGERLLRVGSLPISGLREAIRDSCWRVLQYHVAALERQLDDCDDPPGYWKRDVQNAVQGLQAAAVDPAWPRSRDLLVDGPPDEVHEQERATIRAFGGVLSVWPQLLDAARRLRERGVNLARPIR